MHQVGRLTGQEDKVMKRLALAATFAGLVLLPGVARAGAATDAALGLGAFAVFNQIISGTGIFGGAPAVAAPAPVYAPPAPVYVQPAPIYVQPAPVYVQPAPVYVAPPPPPVVYYPAPAPVYYPQRVIYVERGGHFRHHGHRWD